MWTNVKDSLPKHDDKVFVIVSDGKCSEVGVGYYNRVWGFEHDDSAYEIFADDDSGLQTNFIGVVTHWMPVPDMPD